VLIAIGRGERPVVWASELLKLRNRAQGGVTIGPQGLYLTQIDYPLDFALPTRTNHSAIISHSCPLGEI
jgi:tRNA pseudouridine38-40 synthase